MFVCTRRHIYNGYSLTWPTPFTVMCLGCLRPRLLAVSPAINPCASGGDPRSAAGGLATRASRDSLRGAGLSPSLVPLRGLRVRDRHKVIYSGTSGYSFKEWVGASTRRSPAGDFLPTMRQSPRASNQPHFPAIPPDRHDPVPRGSATPEKLKFFFKMHQSVTHMSRLKNVSASVRTSWTT